MAKQLYFSDNDVYEFQQYSHDSVMIEYYKTRTFSWDKFSLIRSSKHFHSFKFHYSMAVLFYIITKVKLLEAFNFHGFDSVETVKFSHWWNFLVLQYTSLNMDLCSYGNNTFMLFMYFAKYT